MFNLYEGDCLEVLEQISDGSVDMVLCDLPYGTTSNKWDSIIPLDALWGHYKRIGKQNAGYALTASQPFTSVLVTSNLPMFRHEWVWLKNRGSNFANTVREPFKEHEVVLFFSRGKWTYNKQMQERSGGGVGLIGKQIKRETRSENYQAFERVEIKELPKLRVPSSVQKFNTQVGLHPTQKPVALLEYLIKTYTNPGDIVLDNTMGSGSTGVACANTGRRFIGIEKDEKYFQIAKNRVEEAYATSVF